ncbi:dTMP kinase [Gammaproteobacteria bacterium 42_54_T18]|nr:dTMP kinase [Gammaproteobacteria bacterium 42_54_T18]
MSEPTKSNLNNARFLTVEGVEGVGKTTNITFISAWLEEQGVPYIHTREPGGTPLAEELRSLLLAPRDEQVDATAELLMMFAARAQHIEQVIKPALAKGIWVLCDRFTDATYAYQGGGRNMGFDKIQQLESFVQGDFRPDAVILLDLPVAVGLARAAKRGALDRFEQEAEGFFHRVRDAYLNRAKENPSRYWLVDAEQSLELVQVQISNALQKILADQV